MPRRKKNKLSFNFILGLAALAVFGWIAIDLYSNYQKQTQKENKSVEIASTSAENQKSVEIKENAAPEPENGFEIKTYRDERYGLEFQYPVFAGDDPNCPKLIKDQEGFFVGQFSFLASPKNGTLNEFAALQLEGMDVENKADISVAGLAAIKADYQTRGMGWYGSSIYLEHGANFFEFGLLANEKSEKCGGADDYEDRVYQSVISTLKFVD